MATFAESKSNIAYDADANMSPLGGLNTGIGYASDETVAYKGQAIGIAMESSVYTLDIEYELGSEGVASEPELKTEV